MNISREISNLRGQYELSFYKEVDWDRPCIVHRTADWLSISVLLRCWVNVRKLPTNGVASTHTNLSACNLLVVEELN